ncbi:MAG TPA: hypothetical protein VFA86_13845 [Gammaproteobacteria bacterium]|nr:hypothetical protein [Gammaproteobacteria bacterium]
MEKDDVSRMAARLREINKSGGVSAEEMEAVARKMGISARFASRAIRNFSWRLKHPAK